LREEDEGGRAERKKERKGRGIEEKIKNHIDAATTTARPPVKKIDMRKKSSVQNYHENIDPLAGDE